MRIAYITIHVAPEIMQGGVGKKIKSQIAIWREQGNEVTLFSLTPAELPFLDARQFIFDSHSHLIRREFNRSVTLNHMLKSILECQPDLIYLRFGLYAYPLHRLFRIAPVVLEVNSNDIVEYRERGIFFYWLNRLTRNLTFGPASGIIVPAHELVNILSLKEGKPVLVISNGIDLRDIEPLSPAKNTSPVITLLGSPGMNWHGVDKLIKLAIQYPDLTVNIVGYSKSDLDSPVSENTHIHGFLSEHKVRDVLSSTDVACGTLALHRKGMNEASPLKVRESLAYGIPVILAYHDTDLDGLSIDNILRIPNNEDNVAEHAGLIRKFAYDMMGMRVDRNLIVQLIDQRAKEDSRLTFFQEIFERSRHQKSNDR